MKKIIMFFKKRSWLLILIACLIFIPQSFSYQAKLNMRVVVTGIGIDKSGDDSYEVTAQVIIPSPGSESGGTSARLDFISEEGSSVAEGIQKIAYKIGKEAGLSHTDFIMIGETMLSDNIVPVLDYFARDDQVSPALALLVCKGKAKDMIEKTKNLELSVGLGLRKVFLNKQSSLNGLVTPVNNFIADSYGISKTTLISGISISPEGEEEEPKESDVISSDPSTGSGGNSSTGSGGTTPSKSTSEHSDLPGGNQNGSSSGSSTSGDQSSSGSGGGSQGGGQGSSGGGQSSSGGEEKNARIKFYNDIYYFKDGKHVGTLNTEEEILGYFFQSSKSTNGEFKVSGVTCDILEDATIGLQFSNKKSETKVSFENGKPVLKFTITIGSLRTLEILNKAKRNVFVYSKQNKDMSKAINKAVREEITEDIQLAFEKAKTDNVDIFHIGELAYQTKTKEWKKYYDEFGENYLKDCKVEVEVKVSNFN